MKVFYDVDTQNDFMNKDGALYVPGAEDIKQNLEKLTRYAREKKMPALGSVDIHFGIEEYKDREGELQRWGGPFPDHCMDGTKGAEKILETNLTGIHIPAKPYGENFEQFAPAEYDAEELLAMVNGKDSVIFEKQHYDVFTNPKTEALLTAADVKEAVVYGVATDYCVKAAVLGMQKRGIQCYVVEDAISGVAPETTKSALEEMVKAGAKFVKTSDVLEGKVI